VAPLGFGLELVEPHRLGVVIESHQGD
jgi:hypothetical protein